MESKEMNEEVLDEITSLQRMLKDLNAQMHKQSELLEFLVKREELNKKKKVRLDVIL